ncbi:MAG: hypothetical protein ACKVK3_08285 [Acidimicrobiales bacterium]
MTLSPWRRVVTGVAAGAIVLCAALIGASFRDGSSGISVAPELRPADIIPVEGDPTDASAENESADSLETNDGATDPVQVIDADDLPATDADSTDPENTATDAADSTPNDDTTSDEASAPENIDSPAKPPASDSATSNGALGTGGGVDDAECALDRLVVYAGARVGGVAGSIRNALTQAGFGASCATPVTVLASNCPLQFTGVLGAGSGYDPSKSFVASSAAVDRETLTAIMGSVGYAGNQIDILDFSFVDPDRPGEQWMAIFVPPSFDGWESLAERAGLSPSTQSLCAPSGELAG